MSAWLSASHFLRPGWLLALAALPLLLWLWRRRGTQADAWRRACDAHLLPHLLSMDPQRGSRLPMWLFGLGYVLAVLALAGPAFRPLPQALTRADSALIVALDLSERMRSTDLKPDRISRARYKLADLLKARREGQTALIAYAGQAFVVAPLTDDAGSLSDLLTALSPDTMPVRGQRADRAIEQALQLLHDAGFARGDLLLVTDTADARANDAASRAAAQGLRVSVLGVGTASGAPVALPQGGFVQDESGEVLLPRLDEPALRALASAGDGRYVTLAIDTSDLSTLDLTRPDPTESNLRDDERTSAQYRDEGPWLLLVLLPLAALGFRRGWLACLPLALCLTSPEASAFDWSALWQREDQRAYDALQAEQAQRALELAHDPALRGSAAYRAEDYAQAETQFAQQDDADAHYNRANALAKAQRYQDAIQAYDEALQRAPDMDDAQANRKAVEDWLKQQQQQQQQQGEQGDSQQPPQGNQGEPQQGQSQDQQQSQSSQQQNQDSAPQNKSDDASSSPPTPDEGQAQRQAEEQAKQQFAQQMEQALKEDKQGEQPTPAQERDPRETEQQQAVEQWLRRVPDDPGGLLRRKFAIEYQRRRREGQDE